MITTNANVLGFNIENYKINIDDDIKQIISDFKKDREMLKVAIITNNQEYKDYCLNCGYNHRDSVCISYYISLDGEISINYKPASQLLFEMNFYKNKNNLINMFLCSKIDEKEFVEKMKKHIINQINKTLVKYKKIITTNKLNFKLLNKHTVLINLISKDFFIDFLSQSDFNKISLNLDYNEKHNILYKILYKLRLEQALLFYNKELDQYINDHFSLSNNIMPKELYYSDKSTNPNYSDIKNYDLTEFKKERFIEIKHNFLRNLNLKNYFDSEDIDYKGIYLNIRSSVILSRILFGLYFKLFNKDEIELIKNRNMLTSLSMVIEKDLFDYILKINNININDITFFITVGQLNKIKNKYVYSNFLNTDNTKIVMKPNGNFLEAKYMNLLIEYLKEYDLLIVDEYSHFIDNGKEVINKLIENIKIFSIMYNIEESFLENRILNNLKFISK